MSNTSSSETTSLICANCGKEGSDVTNTCNKCNSVMYCNAACKKKHRHKHKKECERRVAELHDEKLFKQPPTLEDCPICMVRLPTLHTGRTYMGCCGKVVCCGCVYAFQSRVTKKKDHKCPFCRTPTPINEEYIKQFKKRADLNDPIGIRELGCMYRDGDGLPQNNAKALKLWHRAAELGDARSYCSIGHAYDCGREVGVDKKKAKDYFELAAIGGDPFARHNLGSYEVKAGNVDRALKHWMIAIEGGVPNSMKSIKLMYEKGFATKDDYAKALRSYQTYLDEIKSDQRDEAAASAARYKYYESAI